MDVKIYLLTVLGLIWMAARHVDAGEIENQNGSETMGRQVKIAAPAAGPRTRILGPSQLPECLPGRWRISLCIRHAHSWIRFENLDTGEIITLGRFQRGAGGRFDCRTLRRSWPNAPTSGVHMNMEHYYEEEIRTGKSLLLSVISNDPRVFRGEHNGYGHGGVVNNCASYARDAWSYYSGEYYPLRHHLHLPKDLLTQVIKSHPKVIQQP